MKFDTQRERVHRRGRTPEHRERGRGEMNEEQAVMRPIDQVRAELNAEFRSAAEIAERLGLTPHVVGGPLGMLRRHGEAERMLGAHGESLWRKSSYGSGIGAPTVERAGELGEDRQVGVQPDPIQSTDAERRERPFVLEPPDSRSTAARLR